MGSSILDNLKRGIIISVGLCVAGTLFALAEAGWDYADIAGALFVWGIFSMGLTAAWVTIALGEDS